MTQREYLRARSKIALTGLAMIVFGWMAGDAFVHAAPERLRRPGGVLSAAAIIAGCLYLVVANLLVRRRYRNPPNR